MGDFARFCSRVLAFLYFAIVHVPYRQQYPGNRELIRYAALTDPPHMGIGSNEFGANPVSQQIDWALLAFQLGVVCAATVASIALLLLVGRRSAAPAGFTGKHEKGTRGSGVGRYLGVHIRGGWAWVSSSFPGVSSGVLVVLYLAGLWLFFTSEGSGGPRFSRIQYEIGALTLWYEFEFAAGELHGFEKDYEHRFRSQFNVLSPAWLVAATAFAALCLYHRLRLRRAGKIGRWERPQTHAILWLALAAIGMLLGPVAMAMHFASQG